MSRHLRMGTNTHKLRRRVCAGVCVSIRERQRLKHRALQPHRCRPHIEAFAQSTQAQALLLQCCCAVHQLLPLKKGCRDS